MTSPSLREGRAKREAGSFQAAARLREIRQLAHLYLCRIIPNSGYSFRDKYRVRAVSKKPLSAILRVAFVAADTVIYHRRQTNYVELARGVKANPVWTRVRIDGGKIAIDSIARTAY